MADWKRKRKRRPAKKAPGRKRIKLRRTLLAALDLPEETEPTVHKLTMVGGSDLVVENHCGVLKYLSGQVRLAVHGGVLCIQGEKLELLEMSASRAYVRGEIQSIALEGTGGRSHVE